MISHLTWPQPAPVTIGVAQRLQNHKPLWQIRFILNMVPKVAAISTLSQRVLKCVV